MLRKTAFYIKDKPGKPCCRKFVIMNYTLTSVRQMKHEDSFLMHSHN